MGPRPPCQCKTFFFFGCEDDVSLSFVPSFFSSFSLDMLYPQPFTVSIRLMFPITVVKRFLNRNVPNIPLPPDIDDELESLSGSWIVPSKPTSTSRSPTEPGTVSIASQTSSQTPFLQVSPRSRPRDFSTCGFFYLWSSCTTTSEVQDEI